MPPSEYRFMVPGRPVSWKRTNMWRGRRLTSKEQRRRKQLIAMCALADRPGGWELTGLFALEVCSIYPNRSGVGDCDNLWKIIADAIQGVAYENDRQIDDQRSWRLIDPKLTPATLVTVKRIGDGPSS